LDTRAQKNQPLLKRLKFAIAGLAAGFQSERSLRFQAAALLLIIVLLIVFRPEPVWWALVALTSSAVLAAELFNTALERLVDHLHPEQHEQIRIVKDCAAAAVLIAAIGALVVAGALIVHLVSRY
jgi:diacylglycerol kinase (ATP)